MIRLVVLAVALTAYAAHAQEKKTVTLRVTDKSSNACLREETYELEISAESISLKSARGSGIPFKFPIGKDGKFGQEFKSPNGGRFAITGDTKSRQLQLTNRDYGCTYAGPF